MSRKRPVKAPGLRARAERVLGRQAPAPSRSTKTGVIHELEVHQVELGLQVEELRRTEQELARVRDRYLALYDEAPVGYVTLDRTNVVTRANRAAARLLGFPAGARAARRFTSHLDVASRSTFYAVSAEVRRNSDRRSFDALLPLAAGKPVWVELTLAAEPGSPELRVTLVDVTRQRTAERQMRELAEKLISLQEKERSSVASTLHDDTGQQLTYLCILLERAREGVDAAAAARIDESLEVARKVLAGIRRLSTSLSPADIGRVGLLRAAQSMVSEFTQRTGIPVSFESLGTTDGLPPETCLAAYRIMQEALTNAARHAEPRRVVVSLRCGRARRLRVEVRDDGRGFDTANVPASLGILSMRERARTAGGTLVALSSPGHGTQIVFEIGRQRGAAAAGQQQVTRWDDEDPGRRGRKKKDSPPVDGNPRGR